MVQGASYTPGSDIPLCPTTAKTLPVAIITYSEAKAIYNRELRRGNRDFIHMAYVGFYEDDTFDGRNGIWFNSSQAYLDIDYSNHGNARTHPIVPHEHDIAFDDSGNMHRGKDFGIR